MESTKDLRGMVCKPRNADDAADHVKLSEDVLPYHSQPARLGTTMIRVIITK
jgi:hypothetical protein